jgi:hypothetical protein
MTGMTHNKPVDSTVEEISKVLDFVDSSILFIMESTYMNPDSVPNSVEIENDSSK